MYYETYLSFIGQIFKDIHLKKIAILNFTLMLLTYGYSLYYIMMEFLYNGYNNMIFCEFLLHIQDITICFYLYTTELKLYLYDYINNDLLNNQNTKLKYAYIIIFFISVINSIYQCTNYNIYFIANRTISDNTINNIYVLFYMY